LSALILWMAVDKAFKEKHRFQLDNNMGDAAECFVSVEDTY